MCLAWLPAHTSIERRIQMLIIARLTQGFAGEAGLPKLAHVLNSLTRPAGSFNSMGSAFAFGCRSSPNGRKLRRQRSIRLLGARAKVSSGRLSVRFQVSKLDLNPCQTNKIKCRHPACLVWGSGQERRRKVTVRSSRWHILPD